MNIAAYPTYDDYKESGFAPVGEIPTHWRHSRIRHAAEISPSRRLDGNTGREEQVVFLPMEAIGDNGQIDQSNIRLSREVSEGFTYFQRGDVVMAKITPCFENGKGAYLKELSTQYGFGTTELHVMRPREVTGEYLYYFLNRSAFRTYSEVFMVGSAGQKRVSTDFLKNQLIPIPPLPEQRAIAAFLDGKCATIDEAVRIKEEQIRLLAERRQILIQQAVTRGLNPTAPMKDSGIDWIGQIPAHWEVKRNKHMFVEINERSAKGEEQHLSMSQKLGLVPADLVEKSLASESYQGAKLVRTGDLVLNRLKAHLAVFSLAPMEGLVSPDYSVFRPFVEGASSDYFEILFKTSKYLGEFRLRVRGIVEGFYRLYTDDFMDCPLLLPPLDEQLQIVEHVRSTTAQFQNAIAIKEAQITALREYKTSLINAAVTGKIKVI